MFIRKKPKPRKKKILLNKFDLTRLLTSNIITTNFKGFPFQKKKRKKKGRVELFVQFVDDMV